MASYYEQVEQTADLFSPSVYDVLTRYDSFKTEADPEAENYIPLSTVRTPRDQCLPFIIGILPPAIEVTGRMLDRSATVASQQGSGVALDTGLPIDLAPGATGATPTPTMQARAGVGNSTGSNNGEKPKWYTYTQEEKANAVLNGYRAVYGQDPSLNTLRMMTAQVFHEQGKDGKWPDNNPAGVGFLPGNPPPSEGGDGEGMRPNSFYGTSTKHKDKGYYNSYATPADGTAGYVRTLADHYQGAIDAAAQGDVEAYVHALTQGKFQYTKNGPIRTQRYFQAPESEYAKDTARLYSQMEQVIPSIAEIENHPPPGGSNLVVPDTKPQNAPNAWQASGADAAQDAKRQQARLAGRSLNTSELGQKLGDAQANQVKEIQAAIEDMSRIPPLKMLVNPASFKYNTEKILNDGNWGRNGPIIHHWGNQQEKIEGSGKLAAFYALDATGAQNGAGSSGNSPGLTRLSRSFSLSYQNFLSLYLLYKSNGGLYLKDYFTTGADRVNLSLLGSLYIYYDSTLYIGSFDSFTITESDTAPFTLEYSFQFTVRAWFLLDRQPDPRYTYGAKATQAGADPAIPVSSQDAQALDIDAWAESQGGGPVMSEDEKIAAASQRYFGTDFSRTPLEDTSGLYLGVPVKTIPIQAASSSPPTPVTPRPKAPAKKPKPADDFEP